MAKLMPVYAVNYWVLIDRRFTKIQKIIDNIHAFGEHWGKRFGTVVIQFYNFAECRLILLGNLLIMSFRELKKSKRIKNIN